MFSAILNLKVKDLTFSCTRLNLFPHFYFTLFPSDLFKYGFKFRFPSDVALRFDIEWSDNKYYLVVYSIFKTPSGFRRLSDLPSYNRRINKELTLRELVVRILPSLCDVELVNRNDLL